MVKLIIWFKKWNQNRKLKNAIKKADWMAKKSRAKFLVLYYNGKMLVKSKQQLKKMIRDGFFIKGFTIQKAEQIALYITKS